jgi:hypothetical protein
VMRCTLSLREMAETCALGIEYSLLELDEVVAWAAQEFATLEAPPEPLLEIAGAIRPHPLDIVRYLRSIPGTYDRVTVFRNLMARARATLLHRPESFSSLTHTLEQMALCGDVPEEFESDCLRLDDARLLAESGAYGSLEDVRRDLRTFLDRVSDGNAIAG